MHSFHSFSGTVMFRWTLFDNHWSRLQNAEIQRVSHWGVTTVRQHRTKSNPTATWRPEFVPWCFKKNLPNENNPLRLLFRYSPLKFAAATPVICILLSNTRCCVRYKLTHFWTMKQREALTCRSTVHINLWSVWRVTTNWDIPSRNYLFVVLQVT
jgi:hypothetical protein